MEQLVRLGHILVLFLLLSSFVFLLTPPRNNLSKFHTWAWTINAIIWFGSSIAFVIGSAIYYVMVGPGG